MLLAGQWALVGDCEQDEDWVIVEFDGQLVTFVKESALEDHPGLVAAEVLDEVRSSFRPPPGGRRVAA